MQASRDKASILIVDDRPEKVLALEAVLDDLNQTVVRAYSGREALRQILQHEFAVILLDVNMPGMDGFETASLIRQRQHSRHTPIIFVTAFGDEMHEARGYSLGAVDYILAPVVPEVLRTKVSVFVDLYRATAQVRQQADSLGRLANQHQKLASAALTINSASSIEQLLQSLTHAARDIVGTHAAIALFHGDYGSGLRPSEPVCVASYSQKYADWADQSPDLSPISHSPLIQARLPYRLTDSELRAHVDWPIIQTLNLPPPREGLLAAPFTRRDGGNLGVIFLSDPVAGTFSDDDSAILVQIAQMTSIAVENMIFSQEREANRLKDEFLATLSHELRTPLNAMLGWTQLLRMENPTDDVAHGLEVIERNVRAQVKLVEDLLDVSRITTGKMRLNLRPLSVMHVIRAAADAIRPAIEAKDIAFETCDDESTDIEIVADPDRLQQVIWNLLANSMKFTPAGGTIRIRVEETESTVRLLVSDTGQGIDPKFLPYVFDRFRQADSTSTRSHGGLGVGLAIVQHIVELHGGTTRALSPGPGQGSTFLIELPRSIDQPVARQIDPGAAAREPLKPSQIHPEELNAHVLLVDDDPDSRELLAEVLRRNHVRVTIASSAVEALATLRAVHPNLLISDIAMPDRDGFDLIRDVRQLEPAEGGTVPAIALTAYARDEDRRRVLNAGFQAHVAKPVETGILLSEVCRLVQLNGYAAAYDAHTG